MKFIWQNLRLFLVEFCFRFLVTVDGGLIYFSPVTWPSGWTHVIVNNVRSRKIGMYVNGIFAGQTGHKHPFATSAGDGRIIVGGRHRDDKYVSVLVDELVSFNASLTHSQAEDIYNSYWTLDTPGTSVWVCWWMIWSSSMLHSLIHKPRTSTTLIEPWTHQGQVCESADGWSDLLQCFTHSFTSRGHLQLLLNPGHTRDKCVSLLMDDLIFFNASLTQTQVQDIYNSYSTLDTPVTSMWVSGWMIWSSSILHSLSYKSRTSTTLTEPWTPETSMCECTDRWSGLLQCFTHSVTGPEHPQLLLNPGHQRQVCESADGWSDLLQCFTHSTTSRRHLQLLLNPGYTRDKYVSLLVEPLFVDKLKLGIRVQFEIWSRQVLSQFI